MTSNLSPAGGSTPKASGINAIETRSARRKRSFITDLYYLKRLLSRRKFEANPLASFAVQKRFGDGRHPAHSVLVGVSLIHTHDPVARFAAIGFPDCDGRSESHHVERTARCANDLR